MTPRTYVLWFGPFVLLTAGLHALYRILRSRPHTTSLRILSPEEHRQADTLLRFAEDPNVAVYRDQLAEIESAFATGAIEKDQTEREREELKRRLLDDYVGADLSKR